MQCNHYVLLLVAVFWTSSPANALSRFLPKDKEVVFDYNAVIRAGTSLPSSHDSEFALSAKLHIQSPNNEYLIAQLKDISFTLFNGENKFGHEHKLKKLPIPKDADDLTKPFKVLYAENGQAKAIVTDKKVKVFVRNMQKALASLLQIKSDTIKSDSEKFQTFITDELSIYSKTRVAYDISNLKEEIIVTKMHEMGSTKHMYHSVFTNIVPSQCEAQYEEPLSHDSQQVYRLKNENGSFRVHHIESNGGFYLYPFRAKSIVHYVHANIILNRLSEGTIDIPLRVENEFEETTFMYDQIDPNTNNEIIVAHLIFEQNKILPLLENMLEEMYQYFNVDKLDVSTINLRKSQLVKRVVHLLVPYDLATLERIYTELSSKTTPQGKHNLMILHQLIPLLGTSSSIQLTLKIVNDKKVDNVVAMNMIHSMSSYVRNPTEKLLKDIEYILTWGTDYHITVRNAAILNFAVLVHKTYQYQSKFAKGEDHEGPDAYDNFLQRGVSEWAHTPDHLHKFLNEHTIYNDYVNDFGAKLKGASNIATQIIYAQALFNTKLPAATQYLMAIAKGDTKLDQDVREMAMWAVSHMIIGNSDKVYETYWHTFSDKSEHTELRIVAYFVIMKSRPSMSRLLNIHWHMQNEPNSELYMFHYTYLQAVSRTTDPCHQILKNHAEQLLRYTRKPNQQAFTFFYQMDFLNKEYGFGGDMSGFYMAVDRTRMFLLDHNAQISNVLMNYHSIFIKLGGLPKGLSRTVDFNLKDGAWAFNYGILQNFIKNVASMDGVEIEICITKNLYLIQSFHFNKKNIHEMLSMFNAIFMDEFVLNSRTVDIHYDMMTEMFMPTEIGMPAYMDVMIPSVTNKQVNLTKSTKNNAVEYHVDSLYQITKDVRWGLNFYNPIVDVRQGIVRLHTYDLVLPLQLNAAMSINPASIKFYWKANDDPAKNRMGLRSYATNLVYVMDLINNGLLEKSCEECKNWFQITKGDMSRHNETLFYDKGTITGIASKAILFDVEGYGNEKHSLNAARGHRGPVSNNYWPVLNNLMAGLREHLEVLNPTPYTKGYLVTLYPSSELSVNQIDFSVHFGSEIEQTGGQFLPPMKLEPRFTYTIKSEKNTIKTWDFNAKVQLNAGHTIQNTKVELTRIIPGKKDYKVCINNDKKWTGHGVNSQIHINMGQTSNGSCIDEATIDINMVGTITDEQRTPFHKYEVCDVFSHGLGADFRSMRCASAHTSIRKYRYGIKHKNIPTEYIKIMTEYATVFWKSNIAYFNYHMHDTPKEMGDTDAEVVVEYLTTEEEANIHVSTAEHTYEFIGLPSYELSLYSTHPDNTHYSKLYTWLNLMCMVQTCTVHPDKIQHDFNEEMTIDAFQLSPEFTMVIGNSDKKPTEGVFVRKREDNSMGLKLIHEEHTLEVYLENPHSDIFHILVDGKEVSQVSDNYNEDWFNYIIRSHLRIVVITHFKFITHLEFYGDKVIVQIPKVIGIEYYGPCVKK